MAIAYPQPRRVPPRPKGKIPESLIYEIMDGMLLYRKGYREVLAGKSTLEGIMGASTLPSVIISHLVIMISKFIDEDKYFVLTGESGIYLDHRNNLANDTAIYDQLVLTPTKISKKYADVPPLLAIEVDISAEVAEMTENGYLFKKPVNCSNGPAPRFGVEKVIWVLTDAQTVTIATRERIESVDWNRNVELMGGHTVNIGAYLTKRGIIVE